MEKFGREEGNFHETRLYILDYWNISKSGYFHTHTYALRTTKCKKREKERQREKGRGRGNNRRTGASPLRISTGAKKSCRLRAFPRRFPLPPFLDPKPRFGKRATVRYPISVPTVFSVTRILSLKNALFLPPFPATSIFHPRYRGRYVYHRS